MRIVLAAACLAAGLTIGMPETACRADETAPATADVREPVTIRGHIVELGSYLRRGRESIADSEIVYELGTDRVTLALLDEWDDTIYVIVGASLGQNPNELAYSLTALTQSVLVTGYLQERSGVKGIIVTAIEPYKAP